MLITLVDAAVLVAVWLIALLCIKNIFSALRNKFVFINGKKATRIEEPLGYWLVIFSWLIVFAIFMYLAITNAKDWGMH